MSENVSIGTLYDTNKTLIQQTEKVLKGRALYNKINEVVTPFLLNFMTRKYYMLLCHELRDYTVFNLIENNQKKVEEELIECLKNRGAIYAIDVSEDEQALEIWIQYEEDDQMYCYMLFPCDDFIIEVK